MGIRQKSGTMGRYLKKAITIFFNIHFWNVGRVPNNTQSRDILKYEFSNFRLKKAPCNIMSQNRIVLQIMELWKKFVR